MRTTVPSKKPEETVQSRAKNNSPPPTSQTRSQFQKAPPYHSPDNGGRENLDDHISLHGDPDDPLLKENGQSDSSESDHRPEAQDACFTYDQACEDCFSVLPADLCSRPVDCQPSKHVQSSCERLLVKSGEFPTRPARPELPLSRTVQDVFDLLEPSNKAKQTPAYVVPSPVTKLIAPNAAMRLPLPQLSSLSIHPRSRTWMWMLIV